MKTAIIFLGLTMMTITSSIANNKKVSLDDSRINSTFTIEVEQGDAFESSPAFVATKKLAPIEEQTIINPETILNVSYQRDVQELIEQDKKIIESSIENSSLFVVQEQSIEEIISANTQITEDQVDSTVRPLYLELTIEDTILENNMIIGNDCNEVAQPLDFEKINKIQTVLKKDKLLF